MDSQSLSPLARTWTLSLTCLLALGGCAMEEAGTAPLSKAETAEAVVTGKADWFSDVCEDNGWYGDGTCDWFCDRPDPDCVQEELFANPQGSTTAYPILLAHGFNASPRFFSFTGVVEALEADGQEVFVSTVPPYQSAEVRAEFLASEVDRVLEATGAERVNIMAHSMGGLDARYMISGLGYGDRVASLTTISTPHRGSGVADVALELLAGATDDALNALAEFLGEQISTLTENLDLRAAFTSITESHTVQFNRENLDDPQVDYQSWAGVSNVFGIENDLDDIACQGNFIRNSGTTHLMNGLLAKAATFVAHGFELRPNDGMVTVESARWGNFRGCIPADHITEVGALGTSGLDPNTGFDHLNFYRQVAFDLAEAGH